MQFLINVITKDQKENDSMQWYSGISFILHLDVNTNNTINPFFNSKVIVVRSAPGCPVWRHLNVCAITAHYAVFPS